MDNVKRILIWVVIIVTPTLFWFLLTDQGNNAIDSWLGETNEVFERQLTQAVENQHVDDSPPKITLVPVPDPHQGRPYLFVSVKGSGSSRTPPSGLIVIDNQGRRTGYDSLNNKLFNDIPNSHFETVSVPNVSPPRPMLKITVEPAETTDYRIEVLAGEPGMYSIYVARHPWPGSQYFRTATMESIEESVLHSYTARLDNDVAGRFLSDKRIEPAGSPKKVQDLADVTSSDMRVDVDTPDIQFSDDKVDTTGWNTYTDQEYGFTFKYAATDTVKQDWGGLSVGDRDSPVIIKVLPQSDDPMTYQYNRARSPLWTFAAMALPRTVGMFADGTDGGIQAVGIAGTTVFKNSQGVEGIQTYVVHESYFSGEDASSAISYKFMGPVYVFPLEPNAMVSPVVIISPYYAFNDPSTRLGALRIAETLDFKQ